MRRQEALSAARELLGCYESLAARSAHLLGGVVRGRRLVEWRHYPARDVVDRETGYQYFYHCHAGHGGAHGHFHVFARLDAPGHRLDPRREARFLAALGASAQPGEGLAHLLAIALTPKGVPCEIFAVNRWVTGGRVLSAPAVRRAIDTFEVRAAGDPLVNRWMAASLKLFAPQIDRLLAARDRRLAAAARAKRREPLEDRALEILASVAVDVDARLRTLRSA